MRFRELICESIYRTVYLWVVRSEKTRQVIIEKTASIFNKKGYAGTYLSDLTLATGLTKGSIYGNFRNKNEVALEAFRYNYRLQTDQVEFKISQEKTSISRILAFLNHYREAYETVFKNGGCAILNTAVDVDDGNDILREEVIQTIYNWHQRMAGLLTEGVQGGELKSVEIEKFAYRMMALIEGSILLSKTLNKPEILLDNIDHLEAEVLQLSID